MAAARARRAARRARAPRARRRPGPWPDCVEVAHERRRRGWRPELAEGARAALAGRSRADRGRPVRLAVAAAVGRRSGGRASRRGPRGRPRPPVRRSATSRSRARRSNRRWPPGVVNAGTRPSSAQRRSVSGSTPRRRLAWPSGETLRGASGRDRAPDTGLRSRSRGSARREKLGKSGSPGRRWRASVGTPGRRQTAGASSDGARRRQAGRTRGRRDGCRRTGPSGRVRRQRDRAHDLAHLAAPAEPVALLGHPAADARRVARGTGAGPG